MDNDFSLLPHGRFPVYTLSNESARACQGHCALIWPPVLTSGRPEAGPGVDQHALGVIVRPDGTRQVTYKGKPLYLFIKDAYIPGITGKRGASTGRVRSPRGVCSTRSRRCPSYSEPPVGKLPPGQGESGLSRYKSLAPGGTSEVSACVETTDLAVTPFGGAELLRKAARALALPRPPRATRRWRSAQAPKPPACVPG